jgi:hypothetical protein
MTRGWSQRTTPVIFVPPRGTAKAIHRANSPPVEIGRITGSWVASLNAMGEMTRTGRDRVRSHRRRPYGVQNMRPVVAVLECEIMGVLEIDIRGSSPSDDRLRSVFPRTIQFQHIAIAIQPLMAECRPICALVHFPCLNSRAVAGSLSNIVMFAANGIRNALMDHRKAEFVYIAFYLRVT